jgi:hypothetical protein
MLACTTYDLWGWNSYIEMTDKSSIWELDFLKKIGQDAAILQIVGDSNLCDFWEYGSSDLPLVYVIWKYIHLGVCILQWHQT